MFPMKKKIGLDIPNVEETDDLTDEKFKICTISNYLSKGLEFDAVIVYTDSDNMYIDNEKYLFYVSCTRAQHQLIVYNQGN